ncbi:MAG: pectinesterase family protein [Phycisphaerae bacterium]
MHRSLFIATLLALPLSAHATDYWVNPAAAANTPNTYTTVQAALSDVPPGTADNPSRIFISPGTYTEHLTLAKNKSFIDLIGIDPDPSKTVLTYNLNATSPKSAGSGNVGTTGSTSFTISGSNFTAANITFANSTPFGVAQAVAVKTMGDEDAFQNCRFLGFQDTLYTTYGRSYFSNCYITGSVDFIFGNGTAVFDHCTINSSHPGYTTAANTAAKTAVGLVIMNSTLTAQDPGAPANGVYLGRPWQFNSGSYASAIFLNDKIGPHVAPSLWNTWSSTNTNPAGDTRYAQYNLTDLDGKPLDPAKFAPWSHTLTAEQAAKLTLPNIFGPASFWNNAEWGVGGALWGPVNKPDTSGVTKPITETTYTDWPLGGTWDPSTQFKTLSTSQPTSQK